MSMETVLPSGQVYMDAEAYEPPMYNDAFPPLQPASPTENCQPAMPNPGPSYSSMAVKSSTVTQVFHVPLEERKYKEMNQGFGETGSQSSNICQMIMNKTGASIEMSLAKDRSMTIVVTGKSDAVRRARRELIAKLQTQASSQLAIPKDHHRYIIGRNGAKLKELELATATKITIPNSDENADYIKIIGTKEGIDKACHEIQLISDEQAKLAFEILNIPCHFHPFICGAENKNLKLIMEQTGAKINVPPPTIHKDEIAVSGEKDGVRNAVMKIKLIYEEKKRKTTTVSLEVRKSQHKYVIGPRGSTIQEILASTGVSVELPPSEDPSETITLRGEQDKLGPAITQVYAKANSVIIEEVHAPSWLHRFIIGRKGKNIKEITQNLPKVHIEFQDGREAIIVEGPPEEVEQARKALDDISKDLQSRFDFANVEINQKFHKHIIGKNGVNVNRIKSATGVSILIPSDDKPSNTIRIEGSPEGVQHAKKELLDMALRMENEKSKDILIDHRYHRAIIGSKGENIKSVRDLFKDVQITFPNPNEKSDIVSLRGPKQDVEKCYKYLQQMVADHAAKNFRLDVPVYKKFHKNIIGKGGNTINKIKEVTGTRIEIPTENSDSDVIVVIGTKQNAEKARDMILVIQKELVNIVEEDVTIPAKYHQSLIGAKGRLVRQIMEECGGVYIHFPNEGSLSDTVSVRGPKDEVSKAKAHLLELASDMEESSFTAEVHAKPEFHKFLIGRGGANIRSVREETGARIAFPSPKDDDQQTIQLIGKKDAVKKAKEKLDVLIKDLENIVEGEIAVDPKFHRHFVARRGQILREIGDEYGNVQISFPRNGSKSDKVSIKGSKDCVEGAKQRILDIVEDLESQVSIECIIPQRYHRTVMGAKGCRVQAVTAQFEVGIKFPDRIQNSETNGGTTEETQVNGDANSETSEEDKPKKSDTIFITGKKENCEKARDALLALVPITEEVEVPFDYHRFIIGQKGAGVRRMMQQFDVNIAIPPANQQCSLVKVTGPPKNVDDAKNALLERVKELDEEKEERMLRNFEVVVNVNPKHHPKIIGRKGAVITKIRQDHDVNIQFPERDDTEQDRIVITGYEAKAHAAKDAILKLVQELEDQVSIEVKIDHRIHSRLIGGKGRAIRKVMDDFKVDIRFPRASDPDPDIVTITGMEDDVYDCKDELLNKEEEYLQDITDDEMMSKYRHAPSRKEQNYQSEPSTGFIVREAPWNQAPPNTQDTEAFPSIGASSAPTPRHAHWGPTKKH
ncbi:vigilin-like [Anneissia japonica]|uniref:vigilin-like n=1 Tax=Anneissia japonica TaxID=1529436 RepID=UPI001425B42E|nr:vigilin-like [Anneissia japonica]